MRHARRDVPALATEPQRSWGYGCGRPDTCTSGGNRRWTRFTTSSSLPRKRDLSFLDIGAGPPVSTPISRSCCDSSRDARALPMEASSNSLPLGPMTKTSLASARAAGATPSTCVEGVETSCAEGPRRADDDTTCDNIDDDCDGRADEDVPLEDECPCRPLENPDESLCNGIDDDCDNEIDEDYQPQQCGRGYCRDTSTPSSCAEGVETPCVEGDPLQEVDDTCDGIDDDCDGRTDESFRWEATPFAVIEGAASANTHAAWSGSRYAVTTRDSYFIVNPNGEVEYAGFGTGEFPADLQWTGSEFHAIDWAGTTMRFDEGGELIAPPVAFREFGDRDTDVAVAWTGSEFVVAWSYWRGPLEVFAGVLTTDGSALRQGPWAVDSGSSGSPPTPFLGVGAGGALVGWSTGGQQNGNVVSFIRIDLDGHVRWRSELPGPSFRGVQDPIAFNGYEWAITHRSIWRISEQGFLADSETPAVQGILWRPELGVYLYIDGDDVAAATASGERVGTALGAGVSGHHIVRGHSEVTLVQGVRDITLLTLGAPCLTICGRDAPNACLGCGELDVQPAVACGPCQQDLTTCVDAENVECSGATLCPDGHDCTADSDCTAGNCVGSICRPEGLTGDPCGHESHCVDSCDRGICVPTGFAHADPGEFTIGSPVTEIPRDVNEPLTDVSLSRRILVSVSEVTQGDWNSIFPINPSRHSGCANCPVERVSWWDALEYLNRRSVADGLSPCYLQEGCGGDPTAGCSRDTCCCDGDFACNAVTFAGVECDGWRLPTEAEWETFARAGAESAFPNGPIVDDGCGDAGLRLIANYCGLETQTVAGLEPNAWGIYDTAGNVREWVWDWDGAYPVGPVTDYLGPESGTWKVHRGGSFDDIAPSCRSAHRDKSTPIRRLSTVGFRAVRTLPQQE